MKPSTILTGAVQVALILNIGGCTTIVGSSPGQIEKSGVAYMLPKSLLPVELTELSGALTLTIKTPELHGDPSKQFVLTRSGNAFSSDNVQVTIDTATGLLDAVKVDSTDETLAVVSKVVSILTQEAATPDTAPNLVFRGLLDPSEDTTAINQQMRNAIGQYLKVHKTFACSADTAAPDCKSLTDLDKLNSLGDFRIEVTKPLARFVAKTSDGSAIGTTAPIGSIPQGKIVTPPEEVALCKTGVCYRFNQKFIVTLHGPDGSSNSVSAALPNGSPTYVLPVDRWPFVKNTHDIKLQGGVLTSVTTDRPSSALALASAPLNIVKAGFQTIGEVVQLKIDLSGKEKALADAEIARIKAQSDLDKLRVEKGDLSAENALLVKNQNRGDLLSLRVGTVPTKPVNAMSGMTTPRVPGNPAPNMGNDRARDSNDGTEPAR